MRICKKILALDFDRTIADTFTSSPSGLGVNEAYAVAVESVFGKHGLNSYKHLGGLRNRSPREVVSELQQSGFLACENATALTNKLVGHKIDCLTNQIGQALPDGTLWPRLTEGFADFWRQVVANSSVFTAILSSGHRAFIIRTFQVHELALPDFIITDDELRILPEPLSKPDPRLWGYLLQESHITPLDSLYIGDDQVKDGGLARNAGVPFLHFAPEGAPDFALGGSFADWRDVIPLFVKA